MARLYVILVDVSHPDPLMDADCNKRGDVIAVVEDTHQFSPSEMANREYRIVEVPSVRADALTHLIEREQADPRVTRLIQAQGRKLNVDALASLGRRPYSRLEIDSATVVKSPLAVIGVADLGVGR